MVYLKRLLRLTIVLTAIVGVMTVSVAVVAPQVGELVGAHRSDHELLSLEPLAERSYIFDSQGNLQGTLINSRNENRVQVGLEDVPETVIGSVLAAEDESFYRHNGINVRSIGRAVDANLESGSASQGGSTITQQVVKNSLVGDDQDLSRKIREAFLAVELEKQMSKDDILERYLNSVYFGGGAYGVQAASEYYFNKNVADVNWAEGALLAALIRSPSSYDPFKNASLARERRDIVFGRLVQTERLTEEEVAIYSQVALPTEPNIPLPPNDYFVEEVKLQLLNDPRFGLGATQAARNSTVFGAGIRVFTTFDPEMQFHAIQARDQTLPNNQGDGTFPLTNPQNGEQTFGTQAIASVQPNSGAVRALVGGPGFDKWQFNLATHLPGRQPGSSMKTFVLAALYENEFVPTDTVSGSTCVFKENERKNTEPVSGSSGTQTILRHTQSSSNCAYLRLGQVVGLDKVVDMAKRLGVRSPLEEVISLPLGSKEVTPIDMASAYATFANDGVRHEPYFIERIEDREGKVLYQHQLRPQRVVDIQTARLVNETLIANVTGGTGRNAQIDNGQPAAGKTGTTNDSADVWYVGYTPQLSTAIWMGAPVGRIGLARAGLGGATGGAFPARTWGRYYSAVMADRPIEAFEPPDSVRRGRSVGEIPNEVRGGRRTTSTTTRTRTVIIEEVPADGGTTGGGDVPGTVAPEPDPPTFGTGGTDDD